MFKLRSTFDEWFANKIKSDGSKRCNDDYSVTWSSGFTVSSANEQERAIWVYEKSKDNPFTDIRKVIKDIDDTVDSLKIDQIIDSYNTIVEEDVSNKIGGDATFTQSVNTCASYSDPYLNTLLPRSSKYAEERGYTLDWSHYSEEERKRDSIRNNTIKEQARIAYNKQVHKDYLIKDFVNNLINDAVLVEQYLHINAARNMLISATDKFGVGKVRFLNSRIIL